MIPVVESGSGSCVLPVHAVGALRVCALPPARPVHVFRPGDMGPLWTQGPMGARPIKAWPIGAHFSPWYPILGQITKPACHIYIYIYVYGCISICPYIYESRGSLRFVSVSVHSRFGQLRFAKSCGWCAAGLCASTSSSGPCLSSG